MATFLLMLKSIHFIIFYLCARETRGGREGGWRLDPTDFRFMLQDANNKVESLGCHKIHKNAILIKTHPLMTSLWCTTECWNQRNKVALLKGTKCWCFLNSYPSGLNVPETKCNIPCPGSKVETCGGDSVASVMYTGYVVYVDNTIASLYKRLQQEMKVNRRYRRSSIKKYDPGSCVEWKPEKKLFVSSRRMTVQICVVLCYYNKLIYALLSAGMKCTCTSDAPPKESIQKQGLRCDQVCQGDRSQTCGGKQAIHSIHMTGRYEPNDVFYHAILMPLLPLMMDWNPFLSSNQPILLSLAKLNSFKLQTPGVMNVTITEGSEKALVTPVVALVVVVSVLATFCACIFLRCKHSRIKNPDYAALEAEEKLKERKRTSKSGRKSERKTKPTR